MNDLNLDDRPEPGFTEVMQNWAIKSPTPFTTNTIAATAPQEEEEGNGFALHFSKEAEEGYQKVAEACGYTNIVDFMNASMSIYGQMMGAALEQGFTKVLLVNPETEEVIQVPLVNSGEESN